MLCEWNFVCFLWILCAAVVGGFGWAAGVKLFGRLFG